MMGRIGWSRWWVIVGGVLLIGLAAWSPARPGAAQEKEATKDARKTIDGTRAVEQEIPGVRSPREVASDVQRAADTAELKDVKPREIVQADHIASGVGLRNRGGGVINLRGAPRDARAVSARLYWDVLGVEPPQNPQISVNGAPVPSRRIGQGPSPCWGTGRNFAYRSDIDLHLLYNGINGDYKVAGIPSSENRGGDPWESSPGPFLAEGATLVVFYTHPDSRFRVSHVYEAPISGQMFAASFGATLTGFTASRSSAKFTMVGADGQVGAGLSSNFPVTAETSFFQGVQIAGPPVTPASPPPSLDASSDWNGEDVEPLNQLWDTRTHIVPIDQGSSSADVRYTSRGDCLVTVVFILGV